MAIRPSVFVTFFALLLLASPLLREISSQSEEPADAEVTGPNDIGVVDEKDQNSDKGELSAHPGVDTVFVFPNNSAHLVTAGKKSELLVGVYNNGPSVLNVIGIGASLYFPNNREVLIQNLKFQEFNNASVPASAQGTFHFSFRVGANLRPGTFEMVGAIIYEIDQQQYQNLFFEGNIEVAEVGALLTVEYTFILILGITLVSFSVLWLYSQLHKLSKKSRKASSKSKVEVGTRTTDANMDEWLRGTSYDKSLSQKSKKA